MNDNQFIARIMLESDRITKMYYSFLAVSEELKKGFSDQAKDKTRKIILL